MLHLSGQRRILGQFGACGTDLDQGMLPQDGISPQHAGRAIVDP
jgi:hypothetical protein